MSNVSSSNPTSPVTLPMEALAPGALRILQISGGSLNYNQERALALDDPHDLPFTKKLLHEAESESATYLREEIRTLRPDDTIIINHSDHDEELIQDGAKLTWYVKPLDGIQNFEHGYSLFTVAISLVDNRTQKTRFVAVYAPQYQRSWWTEGGKPFRKLGRRSRPTVMKPHVISNLTVFATNYPRERALRQEYLRLLPNITDRFEHLRMLGSGTLQGLMVAEGRMNALIEFDVKPASYLPTRELIRLTDGLSEVITLRDGSETLIAARRPQEFDYLRNQLTTLR